MIETSKVGIREYVFIGMLFVIPVAMFMFVFAPRSKATAKMSDDTMQMQKQLDEFRLVRDGAMVNIKKDITVLERAAEYLDKRVPEHPGTEKTIGDISQLAREHDLRTKTIRAMTPIMPATAELKAGAQAANSKKKEYEFRELTVELEGSFKNFYSFLQAVEGFPRIIHVDRLQLLKADQEGYVEAKIKLRIFFRQDEKKEDL